MRHIRQILVGIDLTLEGDRVTPGSRRAALQAQWLAEKVGATLTLFHSTWADIYEDSLAIRQGPSAAGRAALESLRDEYETSGIPVELVLSEERAWIEMIRRVLRGQNDLAVVARRNHAGGRGLGSVSRKLLHKCPAPVWVVQPEGELLYDVVMAATDLTEVGERAVRMAAFVARSYDCALHVVHTWQVPLSVQMSGGKEDDARHQARLDELQREAQAALEEAVAADTEGLDVQLHVGCDAPSHAILEGVERLSVDLLVMGSVSRGGIAGFLVGNTAEKLLDRVPCALLTIKPADFISPVRVE